MKKLLVIGIIILLVGISIPSTSRVIEQSSTVSSDSNTLYVGGSGEDNYTRIQDAIDNASDGDTVFVYNGTYVENVVLDKSIILNGEDKNTTIIDCIQDNNVICIIKDDVKISDFTIKNTYSGQSFEDGINAENVKNIVISYCKIINNQMEGIYMYKSQNISISNNIIESNDHYGLCFYNSDDIFIIANEIMNNPSHGICLYDCSNVIIGNNNISSNGACGIIFSGGIHHSEIINNAIINNERDAIFLQYDCIDGNITGNVILNNSEKGILIKENSHNVTVSNNIIIGNNEDYLNTENGGGICIYDSNDNVIIGNIIKYNSHEEIFLSNALRTQIVNNEINSGFMENLKIVNSFHSDISKNNFRIENNNKVGVIFNNSGNLTNFFNTFFRLKTVTIHQNYWNCPRLLPKAIIASYKFKFGLPDVPGLSLKLPFIILDKNPAKGPYDL